MEKIFEMSDDNLMWHVFTCHALAKGGLVTRINANQKMGITHTKTTVK